LNCKILNFEEKEVGIFDISVSEYTKDIGLNPSNAELNPICQLLVLLGAHPILHISRIRVN